MLFQASKEDLATFKKIFYYVLDLAKCDLSYDIRDRARIIEQLHLFKFGSWGPSEEDMTSILENIPLAADAKQKLLPPTSYRFYLPGSLSQIVLHAAPGYEPLPKPCSLIHEDPDQPSNIDNETSEDEFDDQDSVSGSSDEGSITQYSSQHSVTSYSNETEVANDEGPLIHLSDGNGSMKTHVESEAGTDDFGQVLSRVDLESWLGEQPDLSNKTETSGENRAQTTSARILIKDLTKRVKPKVYSLLNPANGNGLKVDYVFSSEISSISPLMVCVLVSFRNCTSDPLTKILLVDEESVDNSEAQPQSTTRK